MQKASEKVTEKIIEKSLKNSGASDAKVDLSQGKMSIKTDTGEMVMSTGDSVSLPADFPKDIYVIKGAKIQTAFGVAAHPWRPTLARFLWELPSEL